MQFIINYIRIWRWEFRKFLGDFHKKIFDQKFSFHCIVLYKAKISSKIIIIKNPLTLLLMEGSVTISLLDLGSKMRSKYELYRFLTSEANLYLPPYKEWRIEFITDFMEGKKKVCITCFTFLILLFIDSQDLPSYCKVNPSDHWTPLWRLV